MMHGLKTVSVRTTTRETCLIVFGGGATRHTSQQSSGVDAAAAVADFDAPEVVAAGTGA